MNHSGAVKSNVHVSSWQGKQASEPVFHHFVLWKMRSPRVLEDREPNSDVI